MKTLGSMSLAVVVLLAAACSDVAPPANEPVATPAPALAPVEPMDLLQEIRSAAGVARADDLSQCRAIALGAKPCGGPERYLLYSTLTADEPRLRALVERYNSAADTRVRDQDLVSNCQVIEAPALGLEGGFCVPIRKLEM